MAVAAKANNEWLLASEAFPLAELESSKRLANFLGSVAVRGEQGDFSAPEVDNQATLLHALQTAAFGDVGSREVVQTNVATDLAERLYKVAHQTRVTMDFAHGRLQQNGRKLTDIHRNTLAHTILKPEMLRRTKHELKNALLFEQLHAAGVLNDYNAVVFSPTPTAMTHREKEEYSFFLDTESCSVQLLTAYGATATIETAMVAGKATPESPRHDIATITKLMDTYGIGIDEQDGTALLQYVLLVPKCETPNGIVDIVKLYDQAAGGTFYGQAKPQQDYIQYAQICEQRNRNFDHVVEKITAQLVREAHMFSSPLEAIERLDYLSERLGVRYATHDKTIDEAVFGPTAALHIQEARFFMEQGEYERAQSSLHKAQATAQSGSCPILKGATPEASSDEDGSGKGEESSGKKLMTCPFCSAKVFDDPCARVLSCWDCRALVVNGQVKSEGDGGRQARADRRKAKEEQRKLRHQKLQEAAMAKQVDSAFADMDVAAIEAEEKAHANQKVAQLALSAAGV